MSKLALYRKYRPQSFDELYGQDHIAQTLKNSVKSGKFSHAYLFCGPRGTGKTSVARILAKAINCSSNIDGNPDNKCEMCNLINTDKTMDIIEIDAASHTQVDNIRDIIVERANFAPTNLKYKVYIIDEAHMLSKSSFNALLKILEEPPAHVVFILATTESNKIIPTIVSRCQKFDFKRINKLDMNKRLKFITETEKLDLENGVLDMIIEISEGGFRDAISLLDQITSMKEGKITVNDAEDIFGLTNIETVKNLSKALQEKNIKDAFNIISQIIEGGYDIQSFYKFLIDHQRKLLIETLNSNEKNNIEEIIKTLDILVDTDKKYLKSAIPQLALEVAAAKICSQIEVSNTNIDIKTKSSIVISESPKKVEKQTPQVEIKPKSGSKLVMWQEALLVIKSRNNSIHAFLKVCEPEFDENSIKLHFPYKFHKERIEDIKNRQIVEDAINKVFGQNLKVKCYLKQGMSVTAVVEKAKKDDLLDDALEIFGGEVIE